MKHRISQQPFFVDTTLRDGLQAPGAAVSALFRETLIDALADAGIREMEAGIPIAGEADVQALRSVRKRSLRSIAWCRARCDDLESSERCGTGAVHVSFPLSPRHLNVIGWREADIPDHLEGVIAAAKMGHEFVSVGFMDCFRMDFHELASFVRSALDSGADRVRLADSVGLATPVKLRELASILDPRDLGSLEFHGHDDLGLALANSLEALELGFGGLSGTIAGLGERAGNLAWERLALALDLSAASGSAWDQRLELIPLIDSARKLYHHLGRDIPENLPLLGEYCRIHESGIHASAHFRDPLAFMPYNPEKLGLESAEVVAGSASGRGGLAGMLQLEGIFPDPQLLDLLLDEVKNSTRDCKNYYTSGELVELYKHLTEMTA